ncbi:hypothetical protein SMALB_6196 [Streptomyces malaysiensis]|uniref:Uncharacterized protein n=1 Tax=Streptomyces malaysiensis TaxID=92644 RepID=A0A7X5X7L3_STRMQ|nr:hypothetical protein [Streptomyces malaysiensis]
MPSAGWVADLTDEELEGLVGATLMLAHNFRTDTGLLMRVEDGGLFLFWSDESDPVTYPRSGTSFTRVQGTPLRPAFARALAFRWEWAERLRSLPDGSGSLTAQTRYDAALADYESGLPAVFENLLKELTA